MSSALSTERSHLVALRNQLGELLEVFLGRDPLLPGTVYTLRRRCGKPNCRCTKGHLHASEILSYRGQGKTRTITPHPNELENLKALTKAYREFRRGRADFVKLTKEVLAVIDRIERLRVEQGEKKFRGLRSKSTK